MFFVRIYLDNLSVIFDLFACLDYTEYYTRPKKKKKVRGKVQVFEEKVNFEMMTHIPKPRLHSTSLYRLLVKDKEQQSITLHLCVSLHVFTQMNSQDSMFFFFCLC